MHYNSYKLFLMLTSSRDHFPSVCMCVRVLSVCVCVCVSVCMFPWMCPGVVVSACFTASQNMILIQAVVRGDSDAGQGRGHRLEMCKSTWAHWRTSWIMKDR